MRNLKEYSLKDWLSLRPLKWSLKQVRNDVLCALYTRRKASGEFDRLSSLLNDLSITPSLLMTIAFEKPEVIQLQLDALKNFNLEAVHVVVDNSFSKVSSEKIKALCAEYDTHYLKLPEIRIKHNARSHSFALQWCYENLVVPNNLEKFGFIDHDLLPFKVDPLFKALDEYLAIGLKRDGILDNGAWQIWTGFCFFNQKKIKNIKLNFMYDFANGLDSGGRNFHRLFKIKGESAFLLTPQSVVSIDTPRGEIGMEMLNDSWLHLGGVAYVATGESRINAFSYSYNLFKETVQKKIPLTQVAKKIEVLPIGSTYMGYKDQSFNKF